MICFFIFWHSNYKVWFQFAQNYMRDGNLIFAAETFGVVAEKIPPLLWKNDEAEMKFLLDILMKRAIALKVLGALSQAEHTAKMALEIDPNDAVVFIQVASFLEKTEENREILEEAARIEKIVIKVVRRARTYLMWKKINIIMEMNKKAKKIQAMIRGWIMWSKFAELRVQKGGYSKIEFYTDYYKYASRSARESVDNWRSLYDLSGPIVVNAIRKYRARVTFAKWKNGTKRLQAIFRGYLQRQRLRYALVGLLKPVVEDCREKGIIPPISKNYSPHLPISSNSITSSNSLLNDSLVASIPLSMIGRISVLGKEWLGSNVYGEIRQKRIDLYNEEARENKELDDSLLQYHLPSSPSTSSSTMIELPEWMNLEDVEMSTDRVVFLALGITPTMFPLTTGVKRPIFSSSGGNKEHNMYPSPLSSLSTPPFEPSVNKIKKAKRGLNFFGLDDLIGRNVKTIEGVRASDKGKMAFNLVSNIIDESESGYCNQYHMDGENEEKEMEDDKEGRMEVAEEIVEVNEENINSVHPPLPLPPPKSKGPELISMFSHSSVKIAGIRRWIPFGLCPDDVIEDLLDAHIINLRDSTIRACDMKRLMRIQLNSLRDTGYSRLHTIILSGSVVGDDGIKSLSYMITDNIKTLAIGRSSLSPKSGEYLAKAIQSDVCYFKIFYFELFIILYFLFIYTKVL